MNDSDDFNDGEAQSSHELVEDAPVTRAAAQADTFVNSFFDRFAEAETTDDKKFKLDANDFDIWLIEQDLMPAEINGNDQLALRGMTSLRNEVRRTINSAATFGKGVWPPFSIEVIIPGKLYEVRLLEYFADRLPAETTAAAMKYLSNKYKHWALICSYMHSEPVQKRLRGKPDVAARFYGAESAIRLTFKNASTQLQNCNDEIMATYREARALIAAAPSRLSDDDETAAAE